MRWAKARRANSSIATNSAFGRTQAFDVFKIVGSGDEQAGDAIKASRAIRSGLELQRFLRHVQGTFVLDADAPQQRQQLSVAQGAWTEGQQLFTWTGVRGEVFQGHKAGFYNATQFMRPCSHHLDVGSRALSFLRR
jgi:hypothetical protein